MRVLCNVNFEAHLHLSKRKHYTTAVHCTVMGDALHRVRRCFAPPEDHKITPVYGDHLFLIYGCVTVCEHHHFVKRWRKSSPWVQVPQLSRGCSCVLWCATVLARLDPGEQGPAEPCPCSFPDLCSTLQAFFKLFTYCDGERGWKNISVGEAWMRLSLTPRGST